MDGFHCRGLRRILGIPAAYISRVSNSDVLRAAGARPLSKQLLERQLRLFGRLALHTGSVDMRATVFLDGSAHAVGPPQHRRRGRPRTTWLDYIRREALSIAGGEGVLSTMLESGFVCTIVLA